MGSMLALLLLVAASKLPGDSSSELGSSSWELMPKGGATSRGSLLMP